MMQAVVMEHMCSQYSEKDWSYVQTLIEEWYTHTFTVAVLKQMFPICIC